ncbi:hypothetical protein GNI_109470 [Gregarina niphandrodes]|uniref:Uncharacterized protein n=1 Tax=Gregarina niphandrodes TaxID=110365 RepID=A0A023B3Z8_GRENI|nr:hypothetical protein GNI_109470 [Gregarina niphandrodes]EZG55709.1 hypothetical protein GNI_109470 [Gregarina niphandrodes]|eukprot:XP_011131458.1 hypothetical protein GNI_109470 [Gregarina niphandrodes]
MTRALKCVTSSKCWVGSAALGAIAILAQEGDSLIVTSPRQMFELLVRSRDENTYRVRIKDGLVQWLDSPEMLPVTNDESEATDPEASMWDLIMNAPYSGYFLLHEDKLRRFGCNICVVDENGRSDELVQVSATTRTVFKFRVRPDIERLS